MEVDNEVKKVIEGDGWPSDKFRKNICKIIDPVLARNRIMTPTLPVPDNATKIEEYIYSKSNTKEEYCRSIEKALGSLLNNSAIEIQFNEDGTRTIPKDSDFPSLKFRENVIRTFETVYEKIEIPQPLTPQEEEQKLFDAHKTRDEYMFGFIDFLNSLREQQKKAMDAEVDPVVAPVPEPRVSPVRAPMVLKPIPGCTPASPPSRAPPMETRRSIFKRFVSLFTVCVRKDGKDLDKKKKK